MVLARLPHHRVEKDMLICCRLISRPPTCAKLIPPPPPANGGNKAIALSPCRFSELAPTCILGDEVIMLDVSTHRVLADGGSINLSHRSCEEYEMLSPNPRIATGFCVRLGLPIDMEGGRVIVGSSHLHSLLADRIQAVHAPLFWLACVRFL